MDRSWFGASKAEFEEDRTQANDGPAVTTAGGGRVDAEHLGDLAVRQPFQVPQDENFAFEFGCRPTASRTRRANSRRRACWLGVEPPANSCWANSKDERLGSGTSRSMVRRAAATCRRRSINSRS
ncbi:MAG TPA: hypothetical protein VKI65_13290 [Gemmataceae bacterium]|nr:hypothetical protein [Gemmataceae bacterium]